MALFVNVREIRIQLQSPKYLTTLPFSQIVPIYFVWDASVPCTVTWEMPIGVIFPKQILFVESGDIPKQFHL